MTTVEELPAIRACLEVTFCQHLAGVDQLNHVDILLECHDRGRDDGDDPGNLAVDLVGASQLQGTGTPRAGEETARRGVGGVTWLNRRWLRIRERLQEGGGEDRRREGQKVDTNEEQLVEGAADEQDSLGERSALIEQHAKTRLTLLW